MKDRRLSMDYGFGGFFELRTPQQLLAKLRHDHARLAANPTDSYAAFDFFVTANSLVDWIWPSASPDQQKDNRHSDLLPRLCAHLADGAKHFLLDRPHYGVDGTVHDRAAFSRDAFQGDAFQTGKLMIILEAKEAGEIGQSTIDALTLATQVLEYWSRRLGSST